MPHTYADEELDEIERRTQRELGQRPRISAVTYADGLLTLAVHGDKVTPGARLVFPARQYPAFAEATDEQIADVQVTSLGDVIWDELDFAADGAGFVAHILGLPTPQAAGKKGGSVRSDAKTAAARSNGAKGGRPRKKALV